MSSINIFDTSAQADRVDTRRSHLGPRGEARDCVPTPPKVWGGEVFLQKTNGVPGLTALEDVR
jgi:hypothetical protein